MSAVISTGGNTVSKGSSHNRKLVQIIFNDSSLKCRLPNGMEFPV
ncbi:rCG44330 [Rattus norvegicus]|uniref:RCG44330 n=1 Tax=Rattus norvegicus TaxID=10116 RepID=A6KD65_RAT|nr:rCG44330 [Rattus norvegicus]